MNSTINFWRFKFDSYQNLYIYFFLIYSLAYLRYLLDITPMSYYRRVLHDWPLGTTSACVISITKIWATCAISHWTITSNGRNGGTNTRIGWPTSVTTSTGWRRSPDAGGNASPPLRDWIRRYRARGGGTRKNGGRKKIDSNFYFSRDDPDGNLKIIFPNLKYFFLFIYLGR